MIVKIRSSPVEGREDPSSFTAFSYSLNSLFIVFSFVDLFWTLNEIRVFLEVFMTKG
jgi:hypothetical protein